MSLAGADRDRFNHRLLFQDWSSQKKGGGAFRLAGGQLASVTSAILLSPFLPKAGRGINPKFFFFFFLSTVPTSRSP